MAEPAATVDMPAARRGRWFYGWNIVAAGGGVQFLISALAEQSFGAYAAVLTHQYGWSRGELSGGFSVSRLVSGVIAPPEGWLIDRIGPRAVIRIGIVLLALSFIAFSQLNSLPMFYVTFTLIALGTSLAGFLPVTVVIVNWFARYRARALGLSFIGFAVGGLTAPAIVLAITRGWRETAIASGVAVLVLGLPLTWFIHTRPADLGLRVDGLSEAEESARREHDLERNRAVTSTTHDFTAREAFRTRAYWMIAGGHASALVVVSAVQVHLFLHLTESLDYSNAVAAFFLGLLTFGQVIGQVLGGFFGDRMSKRLIVIVCMGMHAGGLLLVAHVGSIPAVVAFSMLHGIAWGTRGPLMAALNADYFGRTSFGAIFGLTAMLVTGGMIAGPIIAGVMYDRTGSYAAGFTVIAIIAALGSTFFVLATRPALPQRVLLEIERA